MEEILENCRTQQNLLEKIERQDNLFRESMQSLQENAGTFTQTMTQAFLMMEQITIQGVARNAPPSHNQPSNFASSDDLTLQLQK